MIHTNRKKKMRTKEDGESQGQKKRKDLTVSFN